MRVLGVTGGIGMGKSACGQLLRERGVPLIDTDVLAHELVRPGEPALQEIVDAFGPDMVDPSGALRRGELARKIFSSASDRQRLEGILHPRIRTRWVSQVDAWAEEGRLFAAVIIPLLFETGAQAEVDVTLCIACSAETQHARLTTRGWSEDQIKRRIAAQLPAVRKMEMADYVVWSEGSMDLHAAQLDRVLSLLTR